MPSEDLSSAQLAERPLEPLAPSALDRASLIELGCRVAKRTWANGINRWFWGEGVALLGLADFGLASGNGDEVRVRAWCEGQLAAPLTVEHVNDLLPGAAAVSVLPPGYYRDKLGQLADWALSPGRALRSPEGALEHWPGDIWADTMFMAGTFLSRFGALTGTPHLVEEAGRQIVLHADVLQDTSTGLFVHGAHRGETVPCYWGRANAWAALAAVEFLEAAKATTVPPPLVSEVSHRLGVQLAALVACQPAHGVWDVLVDGNPETAGIQETSAAAGLAAAMLRAPAVVSSLPEAVAAAGRLALRGSLAYVDDEGQLTRVSAGTVLQPVAFGYSVIRNDLPQPWGQGLALSAIAAALRATPPLASPRGTAVSAALGKIEQSSQGGRQ